jgi:hypothetical protein
MPLKAASSLKPDHNEIGLQQGGSANVRQVYRSGGNPRCTVKGKQAWTGIANYLTALADCLIASQQPVRQIEVNQYRKNVCGGQGDGAGGDTRLQA